MAHFANIDKITKKVTRVLVINDSDCLDENGNESETVGANFCKSNFGGEWKQTSYNANIRGNYAGVGYSYLTDVATLGVGTTDVFMPPKKYESWSLSTTVAEWVSPLGPMPILTDEQIASRSRYIWNEDAYQADNTTGWELVTFDE